MVSSLQQAIFSQTLSATEQFTAQINAWLERLCHKEAELNALAIGSELADVVRQCAPVPGRLFCFRKCTVAAPAQAELDSLKRALSDNNAYQVEYIKLDLAEGSMPDFSPFDLILSSTTPQPELDLGVSLQSIRSLLHPAR